MNNNRLTYWDIGAGVMIIWLLYFHALFPMLEGDILRDIPWFFFFMPWFFYKSGYFFRPRNLKEGIKKDAEKLLKQFAIWSAIGYICYILHHAFFYHDLTLRLAFYSPIRTLLLAGSIPLNNALWFLLTLFFVRLIAYLALSKMSALSMSMVSVMLACIIHFASCRYMPFTIYSTTWGLCFFSAGLFLKKYEQNRWVVIVFAIVSLLAIFLTDIPNVYGQMSTIQWYWYILWYPASIAGCVVFNNLCLWIERIGKRLFNSSSRFDMPLPILKWVGRHSMTFYVAHYIIFRVVFDWVARYNESWYSGWQGVVIITISYIAIIVPLCFIIDKIKAKYGIK